MSASVCTLNGEHALRATVILPRWGVWTADVQLANETDAQSALSGAAKIELEDLTLTGTIQPGGNWGNLGWYKVVGGAAGWAKPLKPNSYRAEAGVKASTVLDDAAREVGETLAGFTDWRVGPAFVRPPKETAARVLDLLAPEGWYVDEAGVTHIGVRAPSTYDGTHRLLESRPDQRRLMLACDTLVGLVPGATVEGLEAATVRHEYSEDELRSHVWGTMGAAPSDRLWQSFSRFIRTLIAPTKFHALYEYRVTKVSGGFLDVWPQVASLGMPRLINVPVRVGAMGARGTPTVNAGVLVGFINGDPSRPFVHSFDGEWADPTSVPTESNIFAQLVRLGDATATLLARADKTDSWMTEIKATFNAHTHIIAGTVPITGAAGTTAVAATAATPAAPIAGAGSVSCAKTEGS